MLLAGETAIGGLYFSCSRLGLDPQNFVVVFHRAYLFESYRSW
jgi:hypothetical protein